MNNEKDVQISSDQPSKISDILRFDSDVMLIGESNNVLDLGDFLSPRLMQCQRCPLDSNQCSMRVERNEIKNYPHGDECRVERGMIVTTAQWLVSQGVTNADLILVNNLIKSMIDGDRISRLGTRVTFTQFREKDDMNVISKYITMSAQIDTRIQKALKELMATRKEKHMMRKNTNSVATNMRQKLGSKKGLNTYVVDTSENDEMIIETEEQVVKNE